MSGSESNKNKYEPGWNDPPMLNYTANNPPPKSRIQNKRVPFPLSSNPTNPTNLSSIPAADSSSGVNSEELLTKVKANLESLSLKDPDVNSKLEIMKNMWKDNLLPTPVQNSIYHLSLALVSKDFDKANQLFLKITMESGNLCNTWLPAIPLLIKELKN